MSTNNCKKSTEYSIYSRRCFVTGEYCSKQMNVQRERAKLHEKDEINAFVVMNFSNMSDVVYKWRLRSFIESLNQYLYLNKDDNELMCVPIKNKMPGNDSNDKWHQVKKINVIRSDSNPASNYVICNRICQQLQIADLIIVDVSVENTNVFYEFGMAVSFGKLILPICYSNSFYEMKVPYDLEKVKGDHATMQKHIGCYPWRKRLFEYYGIRFRKGNSTVEYKDFEQVTDEKYKFKDIQYNRFPYDAPVSFSEETEKYVKMEDKVGVQLYKCLQTSYNDSLPTGDMHFNTLLVYTMDGFLNEGQAGQCIINFYNNMTLHMWLAHCFCGDRVGIMGQTNSVFDDPKDTKTGQVLGYNVEDIIRIGMNEATYIAQTEKIKSNDFLKTYVTLNASVSPTPETWCNETKRFIKEHIRNRCIPVYPDNPIYVKQLQKGLQKGILNNVSGADAHYFCLFHVMVSTLKYTNEVVVDLSKNSVQALFWLGAAHGSGIHAITVKHVLTDEEKSNAPVVSAKEDRSIFDVAGLWTAVFRSNDTEGFYKQLILAQMGIEQHTKLMLNNMEVYENDLIEQLYELPADRKKKPKDDILKSKEKQEKCVLESYYRGQFWRRILRYNQLRIYMPEKEGGTINGEPKLLVVKWDIDAMANLSHYLSKRKIIGKYHIETLSKDEKKADEVKQNFICIGRDAEPFVDCAGYPVISLADHIYGKIKDQRCDKEKGINILHQLRTKEDETDPIGEGSEKPKNTHIYKIFEMLHPSGDGGIEPKFVPNSCAKCEYNDSKEFCTQMRNAERKYQQDGQILLWRECPEEETKEVKFYVSLVGASGPATLALSSLFVDDEQKSNILNYNAKVLKCPQSKKWTGLKPKRLKKFRKDKKGLYLLSTLQETIREKLIARYLDALSDALANTDPIVCDQVKYTASMYLSTALYQYFLPFLSHADEARIYNGLEAFVTAMHTAENGHFRNFDDGHPNYYETMKEALQEVIASFRGVEAFYEVDVNLNVEATGKDTRKITGIRERKDNQKNVVSCLFID